ncbi:hypothetical protein HBH1_02094 [Herbaspirillum sp. BH-1]|uniref:TnsD family Tn7-like transposition protein n=1 Tax=Herbaspirillum sp. (strain BH-1) TaxID=2058884 RepID=UPI000CBB825A|nr:TnsD family Tn7-like transposition protein [Herbaspirillum sp. BH-1]PLY59584.1 hypothetical protein HBH1_02094 [Herbaspirillum sp. BH-1]
MNSNLLSIPPFPDGQIVNDFLRRTFSYGGKDSVRIANRLLLNNRVALNGMPNCMGKFHRELGHHYGDLDYLIDHHTEYNFYCCGLPRHKFALQKERLINKLPGPVRLCRLPLLFGSTENRYLRCPECDELQLKEVGFTYVHRRTGAPLVNVCPIHGVVMRPREEQLLLFDSRCLFPPDDYQRGMTMKLAQRINICMENTVEHSQHHKDDVLQYAAGRGWIGDNGRWNRETASELKLFYQGAFSDARLDIMFASEESIQNALSKISRPNASIHPEWLCIVKLFLDECAPPSSLSTPSKTIVTKNKKLATPAETPTKDLVVEALAKGKTLDAAAQSLGMSSAFLRSITKFYEIDVSARPKKVDAALSTQIRAAYLDGCSPREIQKMFKISASTAYREFKAINPDIKPRDRAYTPSVDLDKKMWLLMREKYPDASRGELREFEPRLYMRLYRNAKEWMEANSPLRKPRTNGVRPQPNKQLVELAQAALFDATEWCTTPPENRSRKTAYRARRTTDLSEYAVNALTKRKLVRLDTESKADFHMDRVLQAIDPRQLDLYQDRTTSGSPIANTPPVRKAATDKPTTIDNGPGPLSPRVRAALKHSSRAFAKEKMKTISRHADEILSHPAAVAKKAGIRTESLQKVLKLATKKGS